MKKQPTGLYVLLIILISMLTISCKSSESISIETIDKNITIEARIAAIDVYGNITLNVLKKHLIEENFDLNKKIVLQFSNGYLIESFITSSSHNIEYGICYTKATGEENPINIGIKEDNLAKIGTLKIGDIVKISQITII